jgi:hypothetical protein
MRCAASWYWSHLQEGILLLWQSLTNKLRPAKMQTARLRTKYNHKVIAIFTSYVPLRFCHSLLATIILASLIVQQDTVLCYLMHRGQRALSCATSTRNPESLRLSFFIELITGNNVQYCFRKFHGACHTHADTIASCISPVNDSNVNVQLLREVLHRYHDSVSDATGGELFQHLQEKVRTTGIMQHQVLTFLRFSCKSSSASRPSSYRTEVPFMMEGSLKPNRFFRTFVTNCPRVFVFVSMCTPSYSNN